MARLILDLPDSFHFTTTMDIRMADINYGGHLGHDTVITLLNEARVRFFQHIGLPEPCIVVADLGVNYKAEILHGDRLRFEVGVADFTEHGCDVIYRVAREGSGEVAALAKTGVVFFDFERKEVADIPAAFRSMFDGPEESNRSS